MRIEAPAPLNVRAGLGTSAVLMAVARQVVGPSGHATRPGGSTLEAYRRCLPAHSLANRHVKVIVNLEFALRVGDDPHTFMYMARPPRGGSCAAAHAC